MTTFDVDAVRARFPALAVDRGGGPLAFFDGPGGTQVPQAVIDAVADYYRTSNANHGGAFATSHRSDAIVVEAHDGIADLVGGQGREITLGPNMTTLTFHASRSLAARMQPGDEIVVTGLDHQANVDPWLAVARERQLVVRVWEPHLEDCTLHLEDLDRLLSTRTRLVAVGWASNAVGTINPIAEIAQRVHAAGALLYVDAVHAAPHLSLDARAAGADLVACSVYKFFGPHVGALWMRHDLMAELPTIKLKPASHPFETGTGNFEGYAGALAAIDYLCWVGEHCGGHASPAERRMGLVAAMTAIRAYEMELYRHLADGLEEIPGIAVHGITDPAAFDRRTPTAAISIAGLAPRAAAEALGRRRIAVWDGDFYATGLIERLGLAPDGVVRIGLTHYNTRAEVDRLLEALDDLARSARAGAAPAAATAGRSM
jgi:cysteine desulfurase family protein (TIGR01976 family)